MVSLGHRLHFACEGCEGEVHFSAFGGRDLQKPLICKGCGKKYLFCDETLVRQLRHFEALCHQIHESQEILGSSSIAIDLGEHHHVKVPFDILLTRLSSIIELEINGKKTVISFRLEPLKDV